MDFSKRVTHEEIQHIKRTIKMAAYNQQPCLIEREFQITRDLCMSLSIDGLDEICSDNVPQVCCLIKDIAKQYKQ